MKSINYFQESLSHIERETYTTDASWRILRINTLIDLIMVNLYKFISAPEKSIVINLISYSAMLKFNLDHGVYDAERLYKKLIRKDEIEEIMRGIRAIYKEYQETSPLEKSLNLIDEYNYLNQLKNYNHTFVIIDTVQGIIHAAIKKL